MRPHFHHIRALRAVGIGTALAVISIGSVPSAAQADPVDCAAIASAWPAEGTIDIASAEAFYCIGESEETQARDYRLTADLDLSTPTPWRAIGSVAPFTGSLDGNKKSISNLSISQTGVTQVGLFANVSGAFISNLTLTSPSVAGGARVGALVGNALNSTISNITATNVTVTADLAEGRVGGLVGFMDNSALSDVTVSGSVEATDIASSEAGGVVGRINATPGDGSIAPITTVTNVSFTGNVSGPDSVGGVLGGGDTDPTNGTKWMSLTNLTSAGTVSSTVPYDGVDWNWAIGGAIGAIFDSTLTEIHSTSTVTSTTSETGGLIGSLADSSLTNASATGSVTVTGPPSGWCGTGGLVGTANRWYQLGTPLLIENVSASGDVSCADGESIGGLVGYTDNTDFSDSEAFGDVSGTGELGIHVGGFAGSAYDSTFTDVSAAGNVSGENDSVGGLIGGAYRNAPSDDGFQQPRDVVVTRASVSGSVSGRVNVGGIVANGEVRDTTGSIRILESASTSAVKGEQAVGGIAGGGGGDFVLRDTVSTGAITGWVNADGAPPSADLGYYGGLVGYLSATGSIERSYTTSTITTDIETYEGDGGSIPAYNPDAPTVGSMIGVSQGAMTGLSFTATNSSTLRIAGQLPAEDEAKAVYRSLLQLGELATYESWNTPDTVIVAGWVPSPRTTQIWGTCTDVNAGLPFLHWQRTSACATAPTPTPDPAPTPTPDPAPTPSNGGGSGSGASPSTTGSASAPATPVSASNAIVTPVVSTGSQPIYRQPALAQLVTGTVTLVPAKVAASAPLRTVRQEPSLSIGAAPVITATVNQPVKLLVPGLTPGASYVVQIKSSKGYVVLGTVVANGNGQLELPVFRSTRPAETTIAIVASTGKASYIKVNTSTGKKKAGARSAKSSTVSARASTAGSAGRR